MDIGAINKQAAESRMIQNMILKWDDKESPLAKLASAQINAISEIEEFNTKAQKNQKVNEFSCCNVHKYQLLYFLRTLN